MVTGRDTPVEVVDVANQSSSKTVPGTKGEPWTLGAWADYYHTAEQDRPGASTGRVYNIISYEVSGTELGKSIKPPKIVRCVRA